MLVLAIQLVTINSITFLSSENLEHFDMDVYPIGMRHIHDLYYVLCSHYVRTILCHKYLLNKCYIKETSFLLSGKLH